MLARSPAAHVGSSINQYPAFLSYTLGDRVHLTELGYCGVTEDALRAVVEKHVKTLLERSEGQITVAELEQTLITAEGPLMRDLLQALVDQRQQGAFPPSAPDDSST